MVSEREVHYRPGNAHRHIPNERDILTNNPHIVIFPIGRELITTVPDLLSHIDICIAYFRELEGEGSSFVGQGSRGLGITLEEGLSMHYRWPGGQGTLFLMRHPMLDQEYVVKMRKVNPKTGIPYSNNQSFAKEALQIQALQADLGGLLDGIGVSTRPIAFASDMVACFPYIDGRTASRREPAFVALVREIEAIVDPYLEKKKKDDPDLWGKVAFDFYDYRDRVRDRNFLITTEGIIWIDQFIASSSM